MKRFLALWAGLISALLLSAQPDISNKALCVDGYDNNLRTGIGFLTGAWTLEAWIKGDDMVWKDREVIFGGGECSLTNRADYLPLVIEKGKLHSTWADLWSPDVLDDRWHHVALTCDGMATRLYLDGKVVDSKMIAFQVIPGALGIHEDETTVFGGLMDEVRIWDEAVPAPVLREWMTHPLSPEHPQFGALVAYYNFDDPMTDAIINWAGKGDQPYHIRNGRCRYRERAPLAHAVSNDNPMFSAADGPQRVFNAVTVESEWDVDRGTADDQVLKLRIAVTGSGEPLRLTELNLDLSGVAALSDLSHIHVYHTGKTARSGVRTELFGQGTKPRRKMRFSDSEGTLTLTPGINYLLVTADVAPNARVGNRIRITVPSFKLNGKTYKPLVSENRIAKQVTEGSATNPDVVKVLQWNIWHGGNHVGDDGPARVIDLIKACHADIITMQEGYGSQQRISDSLGHYLQTPSPEDNLALLSRYPITKIPTGRTFFSNPAMLTLPQGRSLLVDACWLRYAYQPVYTGDYPSIDHNVATWVAEDSVRGLEDIRLLVEDDVKPRETAGMPVIIGGDFNSCSHLDWTAAAAPFHYGYGPVAFPISLYMQQEGYKDSFREVNPDEVERPEGTFAAILGHLQSNRIDFLYYKGKGIRAISSKIIKTSPEIDDVWASDHAAVLTTFEFGKQAK